MGADGGGNSERSATSSDGFTKASETKPRVINAIEGTRNGELTPTTSAAAPTPSSSIAARTTAGGDTPNAVGARKRRGPARRWRHGDADEKKTPAAEPSSQRSSAKYKRYVTAGRPQSPRAA